MIIFLKAKIGDGADLFSTPVDVAGYVTKRGVYVAPHHSIRHKRHDVPEQTDLLSGAGNAPSPPVTPAASSAGGASAQPRSQEVPQADLFSVLAPEAVGRPQEVASAEGWGLPADAQMLEGRGVLGRGKWMVRTPEITTNLFASQADAAKEAKRLIAQHAERRQQQAAAAKTDAAIAAKLKEGGDLTDNDLRHLELKTRGGAGFAWLSPVVQRLFGISKSKVRAAMGDALYSTTSDAGVEYWKADPRKALKNAAAFASKAPDVTKWNAPKPDPALLARLEKEGRSPFGSEGATREANQGMADETLTSLVADLHDVARIDALTADLHRPERMSDKKREGALKAYAAARLKAVERFSGTLNSIEDVWGAAGARKFSAEAHRQAGTAPAILGAEAGLPTGNGRAEAASVPGENGAAAAAAPPLEWGVPAGTSKADRRKLNAAAVALLQSKSDAEMTAQDRQVLARYTGTGGIGQSLNEFYTDPAVAGAMWSMLANAGFAGGSVLEPSSGTGVFLHTAPASARVSAVEIDPIAGRIATILHGGQSHDVTVSSLERFATQDGRKFNAVIGNVPFGLRGSTIKDDKPDLAAAEQYFVDTALDKTEDGGLVALIVPTGIMDSKTGRAFRERTLRHAEFLGAHRLPNTAFEAAHTGVTSDILIFRKRPQDVAGALSTVTQDQLKELGVWDEGFLSGQYFTTGGASNVMGTMEAGWREKAGMGHDITVNGSMDGVAASLAQWHPAMPAEYPLTVPKILHHLGDDVGAKRRAVNAALKSPYQTVKPGDTRILNGVRYVLQGEPPRWHRADDELPEAVDDAQHIAEMIDDLAEGRATDPRFTRANLIEALDEYVREHGQPSRNRDLRNWLRAPALPLSAGMTSEEHGAHVEATRRRLARLLGAVSDDGSYSDLVTGRDRDKNEVTLDTVATKLALEEGSFTVEQLAEAWGKGSREDVLNHLYALPTYALEPDGKTWTTMDSYLSGDLWEKFDAARAMAQHDGLAPEVAAKYVLQMAALEAAIAPQSLEDVEVQLNSGFITPEDLTAWLRAQYADQIAEYPDRVRWQPNAPTISFDGALYRVKGTSGSDGDLLERFLNRSGVRKDERDSLDRLTAEFREWLLGSDIRARVEDRYNRTYKGFRPRAYSDAPIAIPGLNPALDVNAYHFSGLRWAMEAGKGIVAADVGLGKTGRGLMLARLAKVTGHAKKPTFVVPKSVLAKWVNEAQFWFPGSRVLVIGETYSTDKNGNTISHTDNEETRRIKYHQLLQNEYDFVFISQPAWNDLDVDPITKEKYASDDFWAKRGDAMGNAGDKRRNLIRTAYEQALAKRDFASREETVYFNDLGIDMLVLDEGHAYKNLYAARNRFGQNPKFLGGSGLSNRAQDTFFKSRALREANGGKGVFMLTATPTKNSPLEIYSMLSHIAPEAFERMGIKNGEEFLDRFCEFKEDNIYGVNGKMEEALVTAGFKNLGELRDVMRRYIDRKTAEDVGLNIPMADNREHFVDMTDAQEAVYQDLRKAAEEASRGDAEGSAHIFSIMDKMGKASMDLTLLGEADGRSPKVEAAAAEAAKNVADGGQIIFADQIAMHDKIAAALVKAGIPKNKIGIINAKVAASSAARQKISDDFNAGKLSVVIGNTATMGEGMDLQKGTSDIHHLDLPWEPASVQQRNGRGRRQGNKNAAIRIHSYVAKRSFDLYRWQTIAAKRDWQDMLWNGGDRVENLAREGAFSRQEMLIMLSADPQAAKAKYDEDKEAALARMAVERRAQAADAFAKYQEMKRSLARLNGAKERKGDSIVRLEGRILRLHDRLMGDEYFPHKDALKSDQPVLIEPVSGHVWSVGSALDVQPGPTSPLQDDVPSRWVVTGIDLENGALSARRYGSLSDSAIDLSEEQLQSGVTPADYSAEAEAAEIEANAKRLADAAGTAAAGKMATNITWKGLKRLHPDMLERLAPLLQPAMKTAVRGYRDGAYQSHYGLIGPDGRPEIGSRHDVGVKAATHDIMLPTSAHRQRAIQAFADAQIGRKIVTNYASGRRGARGEARGVRANYDGHEGTNPWTHVLDNAFDHGALAEAHAEIRRRVIKKIEGAKTFREAMVAALPSVSLMPYGGTVTPADWPSGTVKALKRKADELGVMDKPLHVVSPGSPSDNGAQSIHTDLMPPSYKGFTVRQFLEERPGGKDEAPSE